MAAFGLLNHGYCDFSCFLTSLCLLFLIVYPKVKVREHREEADQLAYEQTSLQSLKAFEWLSLNNSSSSSDESPRSVVRVPRAFIPKSPPPSFYPSKEGANKKKVTFAEEPKNIRAASAPRPRAVLSSPVNDGKFRSKAQKTKEPLPGLKSHDLCQNRHTQYKVFPRSTEAFGSSRSQNKETPEKQNAHRPKGLIDLSSRAARREKMKIPAQKQG